MTFDGVVYGPVHSRRLGLSLGINLLPTENKVCSFECVYCECGFTKKGVSAKFPSLQKVEEEMTNCFRSLHAEGKHLDVITFAGNGEPTPRAAPPGFPHTVLPVLQPRHNLRTTVPRWHRNHCQQNSNLKPALPAPTRAPLPPPKW